MDVPFKNFKAQIAAAGNQASWADKFRTLVKDRPWEACAHICILLACAIVLWRSPLYDKSEKVEESNVVASPIEPEKKPKGKFYINEDDITSLDFSQVSPYKEDFDLSAEKPVPFYRNGHIQDRVYAATMAIQNLPFNDWILLDQNYKERMALKKEVIRKVGSEVINCLPPGFDGCVEHLELLVEYLPRRYPSIFEVSKDGKDITNKVTGESFNIRRDRFNKTDATSPNHPLYIAGRLIEDDISILTIPTTSDEYVLQAALFGFPAGFHIEKKMGMKLTDIHGPVPTYESRLKTAMNRFFKNVGPSRMVLRLNWGINDRFELFMPDGGHLYEGDDTENEADERIDINQCQLRIERQVLRRLPRTRALAFLAKTYLYPIVELAKEPGFAKQLAGLLHKLPEKFAFYKRKPVWGKVVLAYLDEMAEKYPGIDKEEGWGPTD